jgi:[ribosomal protein S5]-alanine N-acetyltransferase
MKNFLAAVRRSRGLHRGWVGPPSTPKAFREYLARMTLDSNCGFLIVEKRTGALVGVININNIVRRNFQCGVLGYFVFAPHQGRGYMREGLRLALIHAFRKLKLHRLEANIQPGNIASIALVKEFGFVKEGFSRRFCRIGGRWRDHERWALLKE